MNKDYEQKTTLDHKNKKTKIAFPFTHDPQKTK